RQANPKGRVCLPTYLRHHSVVDGRPLLRSSLACAKQLPARAMRRHRAGSKAWRGSAEAGTMRVPLIRHPDHGPSMKPVSLIQFLIEERRAGHINAELSLLIEVVARACKRIGVATGKGALGGVLGMAGTAESISMDIQG